MGEIVQLPLRKTLNGKFSAHCGLCWEPVFIFWVDSCSPDYSSCSQGDYTAQTCPMATRSARRAAEKDRLEKLGLWDGNLHTSLAAEAKARAALQAAEKNR